MDYFCVRLANGESLVDIFVVEMLREHLLDVYFSEEDAYTHVFVGLKNDEDGVVD